MPFSDPYADGPVIQARTHMHNYLASDMIPRTPAHASFA